METGNCGVVIKEKNTKFIIGLVFLILSFSLYLCIPLVFLLPYEKKLLGSIAFITYIISWGLTAIAIFFMGKEGYNLVKSKVFSIFKRKNEIS